MKWIPIGAAILCAMFSTAALGAPSCPPGILTETVVFGKLGNLALHEKTEPRVYVGSDVKKILDIINADDPRPPVIKGDTFVEVEAPDSDRTVFAVLANGCLAFFGAVPISLAHSTIERALGKAS